MFDSFFQGGFECSTHRRDDGVRLDVIASTRHDVMAATDYGMLQRLGIRTVRDGVRWHLVDKGGQYDWSSFLPMLQAAHQTRTQVIWDIMHYGWPDDLDIWSSAFVDRFAAFAKALARVVREHGDETPWYVPVNEISFLAWGGGDHALFNPMGRGRGGELKRQLVRAAIAAIDAVREVEPRARFAHTDPLIHVFPRAGKSSTAALARQRTHVQYQSWDMIAGKLHPELGGKPEYLDVIGVNYYCHNQWEVDGPPIDWRGSDPRFIPFRRLLHKTWKRYNRPMFIAETGIEAELRAEWFNYISQEAFAAIEEGVPLHGLCLYPVMNHPGWADDRHCPNGLIDYERMTFRRSLEKPLAEALAIQQRAYQGLSQTG